MATHAGASHVAMTALAELVAASHTRPMASHAIAVSSHAIAISSHHVVHDQVVDSILPVVLASPDLLGGAAHWSILRAPVFCTLAHVSMGAHPRSSHVSVRSHARAHASMRAHARAHVSMGAHARAHASMGAHARAHGSMGA